LNGLSYVVLSVDSHLNLQLGVKAITDIDKNVLTLNTTIAYKSDLPWQYERLEMKSKRNITISFWIFEKTNWREGRSLSFVWPPWY